MTKGARSYRVLDVKSTIFGEFEATLALFRTDNYYEGHGSIQLHRKGKPLMTVYNGTLIAVQEDNKSATRKAPGYRLAQKFSKPRKIHVKIKK